MWCKKNFSLFFWHKIFPLPTFHSFHIPPPPPSPEEKAPFPPQPPTFFSLFHGTARPPTVARKSGGSAGTCTRCVHVFGTFGADLRPPSTLIDKNLRIGAQSEVYQECALLVGPSSLPTFFYTLSRACALFYESGHTQKKFFFPPLPSSPPIFSMGVALPPSPPSLPPSLPLLHFFFFFQGTNTEIISSNYLNAFSAFLLCHKVITFFSGGGGRTKKWF